MIAYMTATAPWNSAAVRSDVSPHAVTSSAVLYVVRATVMT